VVSGWPPGSLGAAFGQPPDSLWSASIQPLVSLRADLVFLTNLLFISKFFQGCFYLFVISGLEFIRLWVGPLPSITCDIICFSRNLFLMVCSATLSIQIIMRYHFVCKWKRIRVMKDNLIVRLAIICTFGGTIWLSFAKSYVFEEEQVLKVNESRTCCNRVI
jgi:hypothetical protein